MFIRLSYMCHQILLPRSCHLLTCSLCLPPASLRLGILNDLFVIPSPHYYFCLHLCFCVTVWFSYFLNRNWILNNVLGLSFSIEGIALGLGSFRSHLCCWYAHLLL